MITIYILEEDLHKLHNDQPVQYWYQKPTFHTITVLLTYKELIELKTLNAIFEEQKKQTPLPF